MKTSLSGSFGRLSSRERTLVGGLIAMVALLVLGGGGYYVQKKLKAKESEIARNRADWTKVQKLSAAYMSKLHAREALMDSIKSNPDAGSPDTPVAQLAVRAKVRFRSGSSLSDETGMMNKILQQTGDERTKPLLTKRRNQSGPQILRVAKEFAMEREFGHVEDVFSFLESVEALTGLVFVSRLELLRAAEDPDYVKIKLLTASTLRYVENEGEE